MDYHKLFPTQLPRHDEKELPVRLVAPEPHLIPEESAVKFVVVENIKDIISASNNAVLLFSDENGRLLKCFTDYCDLFGCTLNVLSGVPTADYNPQFDANTYSLERTSYENLVNELIEAQRVKTLLEEENQSGYEKERKQYTRKSGYVKELPNAGLAGIPDRVEQDAADDADGGSDT